MTIIKSDSIIYATNKQLSDNSVKKEFFIIARFIKYILLRNSSVGLGIKKMNGMLDVIFLFRWFAVIFSISFPKL